jgi:hypothetical protein
MTFRLPNAIKIISTQHLDTTMNQTPWFCYRHVNDKCYARESWLATTTKEKEKLLAITDDVTSMFYNSTKEPIQAHRIFQQFERYHSWHDNLPSAIRNFEDNASQALPHVLSLL